MTTDVSAARSFYGEMPLGGRPSHLIREKQLVFSKLSDIGCFSATDFTVNFYQHLLEVLR
jgi:hypothetical protein